MRKWTRGLLCQAELSRLNEDVLRQPSIFIYSESTTKSIEVWAYG